MLKDIAIYPNPVQKVLNVTTSNRYQPFSNWYVLKIITNKGVVKIRFVKEYRKGKSVAKKTLEIVFLEFFVFQNLLTINF